MNRLLLTLMVVLLGLLALSRSELNASEPLRAGIIGCDTSHAVHFTEMFNDPNAEGNFAKINVVAVYPGGSEDIPSSQDRVEGIARRLGELGVERVETVEDLLQRVDVVLLESSDGRVRLRQSKAVFTAGKPVFLDKPVAASLADVLEIFQLAEEHDIPCFSSSALRFDSAIQRLRNSGEVGEVAGCAAFSPCPLEPHHPDLFWYGVHGVELLYTIQGPGCKTVTSSRTDGTESATGIWHDGRVGTFRGIRTGRHGYGAVIYGSKKIVCHHGFEGYEVLVEQIAEFFLTGTPPVNANETIEIYTFMEAVHESRRLGSVPVSMKTVLDRACAEVEKRRQPAASNRP